ncbi:MAG TPA: hypothetical protein VKP68_05290, partial [Ramlibacter sp.]|nr:hypothetical protein [Ramlibacter sp.]
VLRRRGWNVVFLGADVPLEHLEDTAREVRAALVIMGAQRLYTAVGLRDASALLSRRQIPVAYGGYIFNQIPDLRAQIDGEFLGEAVERALECIEKLMEKGPEVKQLKARPANFAAQAYRTLRSEVEVVVRQRLAKQVNPDVDLAIANSYFGSALSASLELGNIAYLGADMDWIHFLLTRPRLPFDSPRLYLQAYTSAVRQVMGATGTAIADWLEQYGASLPPT